MERLLNHREFPNADDGGQRLDSLGRRPREYFARVHPFQRYSDRKFQARYRVTKNIAAVLADDFGASDFANSGRPDGGGLSHRDQVCKLYFLP